MEGKSLPGSRETARNTQRWPRRKIEGHLAARKPKKAWQTFKGWYKASTKHALKASKMSLAAQTAKHIALYRRVASKRDPIPIYVNKVDIPDDIPSDAELQAVVRELQNGLTAGATGLQAEHIKVWLADVMCKEEEQSDVELPLKEPYCNWRYVMYL